MPRRKPSVSPSPVVTRAPASTHPVRALAASDNHHHGSAHLSVWLPQPPEIQESLIDADPARFFRPPYVGPRGWVGVVLDTKPDWDMVAQLVHEAYRHVATRKLVARMPG